MNNFKNWKRNLTQLDLLEGSELGLSYYAGCLGALNSWLKKENNVATSFQLNPDFPLKASLQSVDGITLAANQLTELFLCAYSLNNEVPVPIDVTDDSLDFIHFENKEFYSLLPSNRYLQFQNDEMEFTKLNRVQRLIFHLGLNLRLNDVTTEEQAFALGIKHFDYWHNYFYSTNFNSFFSSVIRCNVMPTVFADVINLLPQPEKMQSNPDVWTLSKEIDNRMKNHKYNLDVGTMQWIWGFHNYIFYEQGQGHNIKREKYADLHGFKLMLSDIFRNIDKFGENYPIKSKRYKFQNVFNDDKYWEKFCSVVNYKVKEDFGTNEILDFQSDGEFYSFYSYRYINAMLLFLTPKKKFLFFRY